MTEQKKPTLASLRRAACDFGYKHPNLEDWSPVVDSMAKFLGREPTEREKTVARDGFIAGQSARAAGNPNPSDVTPELKRWRKQRGLPEPKGKPLTLVQKVGRALLGSGSAHSARKRHGHELEHLKAQHAIERRELADKHTVERGHLKKRQARELASARSR